MRSFQFGSRCGRLHLACPLIVAAQLVACGGGSDGGNTTTPPPPAPPPATVSLTLEGMVTDSPIANAEVSATVGDETFTATADANGNYSLDIEILEADADGFVTLLAQGVNEQSFVTFTSLAGSFAALADQAGDDAALSSEENFATQITNVSTAEAVLLQQANDGEPITNDELLQSLGSAVNAQDVLDIAAAIKLAVDSATDYPLPEGASILDIVSDPEAWPQFVADAYEQDPEAFSAVQTAIAQDPMLTPPVSIDDVPESLMAAMLSTDAGFTLNFGNRISDYTFNADGTGRAAGGSFDQPMTWDVEGTSIKVTYTAPVETFGYPDAFCNGTLQQVYASTVSEGVSLTLLSERTLAITETTNITYLDPGCALDPKDVTETMARTILTDDDFQTLYGDEIPGVAQAIYVYDGGQNEVVSDIADFAAAGNIGSTRLLNKTFTWSVDASDLEVTLTFDDGTVGKYRILRDFDELGSDMFFEITTADAGYVDAGASVFVDPELAVTLTADGAVGKYYQFGVGEETFPDPRLKGFFLRIDQGGAGAQVYDYVDLDGNVVTIDETADPYAALQWTLEGNELVLRRTFEDIFPDFPANCVYGTGNCVLSDHRRIIPIGEFDRVDGGTRVYVLEVRRSAFGGINPTTPTTYLVRFYDTESETSALTGSAKLTATGNNKVIVSRPHGLQRH